MHKLFDVEDFPPNLTELTLHGCFLMEDPMGTLSFLYSVETWRREEGAMHNLKELHIVECKLKIFPRGLWPVTTLSNLKLGCLPRDFETKVQDQRGENWYRIEHVLPL